VVLSVPRHVKARVSALPTVPGFAAADGESGSGGLFGAAPAAAPAPIPVACDCGDVRNMLPPPTNAGGVPRGGPRAAEAVQRRSKRPPIRVGAGASRVELRSRRARSRESSRPRPSRSRGSSDRFQRRGPVARCRARLHARAQRGGESRAAARRGARWVRRSNASQRGLAQCAVARITAAASRVDARRETGSSIEDERLIESLDETLVAESSATSSRCVRRMQRVGRLGSEGRDHRSLGKGEPLAERHRRYRAARRFEVRTVRPLGGAAARQRSWHELHANGASAHARGRGREANPPHTRLGNPAADCVRRSIDP